MNPSTAQAAVIVDELVRNRVRHVVLCPGSRNAPLSFALAAAASAGRLQLHVRIDERSAAFLALGLSLASGRYAAVVCTSGTAVANLHPAMLEAWHAQAPLLALTADRPPELQGTGANQTTLQHGIFGPQLSTVDFPTAERRTGQNAAWRALLCRSLAAADGPVHVNIPFREPLVPGGEQDWPEALDGRAGGGPWTVVDHPGAAPGPPVPVPARSIAVLGSGARDLIERVAATAVEHGWPVIAEPQSAPIAAAAGAHVIRHGSLVLAAGRLPEQLRPDAVIVAGRPTLARGVQRLIAGAPDLHVVDDVRRYADPQFAAAHVHASLEAVGATDHEWLRAWRSAETAAATAVRSIVDATPWPTGLHVAGDLIDALPPHSSLFLGSSNPIRDVDLVAGARPDIEVFANRGLAGIDGSIATAAGIAMAGRAPAYALMGDLTFLHDVGGLVVPTGERRPDLTVVVLNDRGGGIFTLLEQGAAEFTDVFERVFGTPHDVDLSAVGPAFGVETVSAASREDLAKALAPAPGFRVVVVPALRTDLRTLHERLRAAVREALNG